MLLLMAVITFGVFLLIGGPRLSEVSEMRSEKEVRAYIDGKPVDSYLKEK